MSAWNMFPRYIQENKVMSGGKWTTWPLFFWSQLHLLMPKLSPPFCLSSAHLFSYKSFFWKIELCPSYPRTACCTSWCSPRGIGIGKRWIFICHILVLSHFLRTVLKLVKRKDLQSKKQKATPVTQPGCLTSYLSSRWDQGGFCAVQQPGHLSLHGECQHEAGNRSDVNQSLCHCQLPCHHGSNK